MSCWRTLSIPRPSRNAKVLLLVLAVALALPAAARERGVVVETMGADGAGLEVGDRILRWRQTVNGEDAAGELADPFDWAWLEVERVPRGPVTLEVKRAGSRRRVVLQPGTRGPSLWDLTVRPVLRRRLERRYVEALSRAEAGDVDGALTMWRALLFERRVAAETNLKAWMHRRAAAALIGAGRLEEALAELAGAAEAADAGGSLAARLAVRDEWGRTLYRAGEYERALEVHQEALALRDAHLPGTLEVAAGVHDVGTMMLVLGDLDGAAEVLQRAVAVRERLAPDSLALAESLNNLGLVAVYAGRFDDAQPLLDRTLEIRERLVPGSTRLAASYNNLGLVAKERGDWDAAERYYEQDLALTERLEPNTDSHAITLMNLGAVVWERGDLDRAEERFQQSLAIVEAIDPRSIDVAANLNNLALVFEQRGDLAEAEANLRQAFEIWSERTPDSQDVASALLNLGLIAWRRKDLDNAESLLGEARAMLDRIAPENQTSAMIVLTLGDVALDRGDLDRAEALYRQSLEIREKIMPDSAEIAANLINLGAVAQKRGDLESATALYRRAYELRQRTSPDSLFVAASLQNLGDAALAGGDLKAAEGFLGRALAIRSRLAPGSSEEAVTLHSLAQASRRAGRASEALERLERAVAALEAQGGRLGGSEEARAGFRAHFAELYRELIEVQLELGRPGAAFDTFERSRGQLFLATLAERDLVFSGDVPDELERRRKRVAWEYDAVQKRLAELDPASDAQAIDDRLARLAELRRERETVAEEIRAASPRLASLQDPHPLDAEAARRSLEPGTLVLAFSVGRDASTLFSLSRDGGLTVHPLTVGEGDLRAAVRDVRTAIVAGGREGFAPTAYLGPATRLYDLLIGPAAAEIEAAERLVLIPDGPLHALPFAVLATLDTHGRPRFLVERRPLSVALSVTVLDELAHRRRTRLDDRASWHVVGFGDPAYPNAQAWAGGKGDAAVRSVIGRGLALEPLPATRAEVEELSELWGDSAAVFLGAAATESRALAQDSSEAVLHFACHGLLDEDFPLDSGLALAIPDRPEAGAENGLLQAWEIFESMRLDAEVVTLSACQTGLGRELGGEGLVGLSRAFQYAGARSVVASLWSVADQSTARLMAGFYRALRGGSSVANSLRAAQVELIQGDGDPDDRHPFHWAAFQVVGDWR